MLNVKKLLTKILRKMLPVGTAQVLCSHSTTTETTYTVPDITQFKYLLIYEEYNGAMFFCVYVPVDALMVGGWFSQYEGTGSATVHVESATRLRLSSAYNQRVLHVNGIK